MRLSICYSVHVHAPGGRTPRILSPTDYRTWNSSQLRPWQTKTHLSDSENPEPLRALTTPRHTLQQHSLAPLLRALSTRYSHAARTLHSVSSRNGPLSQLEHAPATTGIDRFNLQLAQPPQRSDSQATQSLCSHNWHNHHNGWICSKQLIHHTSTRLQMLTHIPLSMRTANPSQLGKTLNMVLQVWRIDSRHA